MKNISFIIYLLAFLSIPSICYARGGDGGIFGSFIAIFVYIYLFFAILEKMGKHPVISFYIIISVVVFILIKKFG